MAPMQATCSLFMRCSDEPGTKFRPMRLSLAVCYYGFNTFTQYPMTFRDKRAISVVPDARMQHVSSGSICKDSQSPPTFMTEKPPPSTLSLSMARMTSSSVIGSALDPLLLYSSIKSLLSSAPLPVS